MRLCVCDCVFTLVCVSVCVSQSRNITITLHSGSYNKEITIHDTASCVDGMYTYTNTCIQIYTYIHVYVHVYTHVFVHIYTFMCMDVHTYIYIPSISLLRLLFSHSVSLSCTFFRVYFSFTLSFIRLLPLCRPAYLPPPSSLVFSLCLFRGRSCILLLGFSMMSCYHVLVSPSRIAHLADTFLLSLSHSFSRAFPLTLPPSLVVPLFLSFWIWSCRRTVTVSYTCRWTRDVCCAVHTCVQIRQI